MSPEEAQKLLDLKNYNDNDVIAALTFIANMSEEIDTIIVNPDSNGGKYEVATRKRYVTQWLDK